jgi:phospholipid/cholesterol/gamma-HCH transport system permease protein
MMGFSNTFTALSSTSTGVTPEVAVSTESVRNSIRQLVLGPLEWFGEIGEFCFHIVKEAITPPYEWKELLRQLDEVGAKSLPLVLLAGSAVGVVSSLRTRESLERFGAKSLLPALIVLSIIKETGPIITALVVSGRVGAGMGAELGSMKVTEQIDAMEASAVNPLKYLAATRVVACVLMLPLLTVLSDFFGIMTGWIATNLAEPMTFKLFLNYGFEQTTFSDFLPSMLKAAVFGLIIGLIGCFQGMRASGGTSGVGRASTSAVVLSSLFVILADVILVRLIITLFE